MYSLDYLEETGAIPEQIIDYMKNQGHYPKYFDSYSVSKLANSPNTVTAFLSAKGWVYYFTISDDDSGVRWDVFHPDEIIHLLSVL